jgi:hypothetical protein
MGGIGRLETLNNEKREGLDGGNPITQGVLRRVRDALAKLRGWSISVALRVAAGHGDAKSGAVGARRPTLVLRQHDSAPVIGWRPPGLRHPVAKLGEYMSGLTLDGSKRSWFVVVFGNSRLFPVTAI